MAEPMTRARQPLPEIPLQALARPVYHWLIRGEDRIDPFDLEAPYQRDSVWTIDQRQALIKSLIMRLPVGVIIVSTLPHRLSTDGRYFRVVDGKQRIEAVRAFVNDEVPIPAWWLHAHDLNQPKVDDAMVVYSDLGLPWRRGFEMSAQMPGAEFDASRRYLGKVDGKSQWEHLNGIDTLRAEAEVFGLINGGGIAQTEEHMAKVAAMAACPNDTNGDGDCGNRYCPHCGGGW